MKTNFLFLFLVFYFNVHVIAQKKIFISIYPIGSSNAVKGFYTGNTDSAVIVFSKHQRDTIFYLNIHQIKTRRRTGHHILLSSVIGAVAGTVTGIITHKSLSPSDPNCQLCTIIDNAFRTTRTEDAVSGALLGAALGTATGTIIGLVKKREALFVGGNFQNWKEKRTKLEAWPVYAPGS